MGSDDWRPGSETPRAASFKVAFCEDPHCGLHLVSIDEHGKAICETVMTPQQTLGLIEICRDNLYEKAVKRTGKTR